MYTAVNFQLLNIVLDMCLFHCMLLWNGICFLSLLGIPSNKYYVLFNDAENQVLLLTSLICKKVFNMILWMRYRCDAIWKQKKEERECYVKSERVIAQKLQRLFQGETIFISWLRLIFVSVPKLNYFCGGNST